MRISVFGIGYVGAVTSACLCESGHDVVAIDTDGQKVQNIQNGLAPIIEKKLASLIEKHASAKQLTATSNIKEAIEKSDISLICVGTPSKKDGSLDLKYVEAVCEEIGHCLKDKSAFHTIALRSTMLPGSAEDVCRPILERTSGKKSGTDFGFGNNPEFLREGSAINDYFNPPKIVVGADDNKSAEIIMSLYDGIEAPRITTEIKIAEGVKYADNAWHAMKIGFANEMGNILADCGVDSHKVMDIFCQDEKLNISKAYLKPGFAFGGSCLPKDVRAIRALGKNMGLNTPLFDSLMTANDNQISRAFNKIKNSNAQNIVMLGLSFKAGTDDTRESPLVTLAQQLINAKYDLKIYDPNVFDNYRSIKNDPIQNHHFIENISNIPKDADLYVIGNHGENFVEIINALNNKTSPILDLVRLNTDIETRENYSGICW